MYNSVSYCLVPQLTYKTILYTLLRSWLAKRDIRVARLKVQAITGLAVLFGTSIMCTARFACIITEPSVTYNPGAGRYPSCLQEAQLPHVFGIGEHIYMRWNIFIHY